MTLSSIKKKLGKGCFLLLLLLLLLTVAACSSSEKTDGAKLSTKSTTVEDGPAENDATERPEVAENENRYLAQLSVQEQENFKRHGPTRDFRPDKFLDVTEELGLGKYSAQRIMAVDFDQDGYTDLVLLADSYAQPKFLRFIPNKKKFQAIEYDPFLGNVPRASYMVFVDLDKDRVLDLIVGVLNQKSEVNSFPLRVFKGRSQIGRIFYKEIKDAFPGMKPGPFATISLLDYNLDGYLDLFVGAWFEKHQGVDLARVDQFWEGQGLKFVPKGNLLKDQKIQERGRGNFVSVPTFGSSTCDLDQNGYPDILTSASSGGPNSLWMNLEVKGESGAVPPADESEDPNLLKKVVDRHFVDYGRESGYDQDEEGRLMESGGGNSQYSLCLDYNNDGVFDIIQGEIAHYYDPETRDRSAVLTGASPVFPPKFVRTEYHSVYQIERWNQGDRRGVVIDHNVDGLSDILIDNSGFPPFSRLILFEQETNHAYSDVAETSGLNLLNPSGTVVIDFNRDGLMDIVTGQVSVRASEITPRLWAFKNIQGRKGRRSISFHLQGEKSNSGAFGSLVILKTPKKMMRQWYQPSYGNLPGQNEAQVHFGLGTEDILEVEVRWPFMEVDKLGRQIPIIKKYDLSNFLFQDHVEITLCENGRYKRGHFKCY